MMIQSWSESLFYSVSHLHLACACTSSYTYLKQVRKPVITTLTANWLGNDISKVHRNWAFSPHSFGPGLNVDGRISAAHYYGPTGGDGIRLSLKVGYQKAANPRRFQMTFKALTPIDRLLSAALSEAGQHQLGPSAAHGAPLADTQK
jgi:hypothetical protein